MNTFATTCSTPSNTASLRHQKPADKENDYGANIGGPILLPKMHGPDSSSKGYFYFNWEGFQDHGSANSPTLSIASLNARNGDFSGWGSQIYYPNDPGEVRSGWPDSRSLLRGEQPDRSAPFRIQSPSLDTWRSCRPPRTTGKSTTTSFRKSGQGSLTNSENVWFWRVDMNLGSNDHLYYTYWWQYAGVNTRIRSADRAFDGKSRRTPRTPPIQRLNWEHNFSGKMTNHLTLGYLNRNEGYYALNGQSATAQGAGSRRSAGRLRR